MPIKFDSKRKPNSESRTCNTNHNIASLDVTEQRDASQDPVVWGLSGPQHHSSDVGQVGAPGLLVDGAEVEPGVLGGRGVDGHHVDDRQGREQHLGSGLHQAAVPSVPAGAVQMEAIHVHALLLSRKAHGR